MTILEEPLGAGVFKIRLAGRFDIAGAERVDLKLTAMTASPRRAIVIDLSGVNFLASIGIRSLLTIAKAVQGRGGHLVLLDPNPLITRVLEIAGIDLLVPIVRDLPTAVAQVSAP